MANSGPNDWTARDRYNRALTTVLAPTVASALLVVSAALAGLATFYVKTSFSEVKDKVALVSQESKETAKDTAVLKEAVSTMKGDIKDIKDGQKAVGDKLDRLIEMQRRPR